MARRLAGGLGPWRTRRLERHLESCEGCRHEPAAYAALDRALAALPAAAVIPAALEREALRGMRAAAAAARAGGAAGARAWPWRWWWMAAPAGAAAAVTLGLLVAPAPPRSGGGLAASGARVPAAVTAGRAASRAVAAGDEDTRRRRPGPPLPEPPPGLAARPDLFVDLPLLRNLERLEHFEAIQTTTLDEPADGFSNG